MMIKTGIQDSVDFTGKGPRKGWRTPLNIINDSEQRDGEKEGSRGPFASERGDEPRSGIPNGSTYSYTYFGARYMDHELMTMWLSVDPMANKYPSISPYAYCAWNPITHIDPDGRNDSIILHGDVQSRKSAIIQMNIKLNNIRIEEKDNGSVSYSGVPKTEEEKYVAKIIDSKLVTVHLYVQTNNNISNKMKINEGGGAFMGNTLEYSDKDVAIHANASQFINVKATRNNDQRKGILIWHEVSEAYEGGIISMRQGQYSPNCGEESVYHQAHREANKHFNGELMKYELRDGAYGYSLK